MLHYDSDIETSIKHYTGIGSRETPPEIYQRMIRVSQTLCEQGWILRSGKADGADEAFQIGVQMTVGFNNNIPRPAEIYIPWNNFKSGEKCWDKWDIVGGNDEKAREIAAEIHPAWNRCSRGGKALHTRNVFQILGRNLNDPSKFVLFWAKENGGVIKGGTATAVNLAKRYNIPTINMFHTSWYYKLKNIGVEV